MTTKIKDYSGYELYDFLMDEQFKSWTTGERNEAAEDYWQRVITAYPEKKAVILTARQLAQSVKQSASTGYTESSAHQNKADRYKNTDQHRKQALWDKINQEIGEDPIPHTPFKSIQSIKGWYKYAAVILCVMGATVAIMRNQQPTQIAVATGNGEVKTLMLPDSSEVQLAANSSISYPKNMHSDQIREVTIHGEANLIVKHLNKNPLKVSPNDRFIVHLKHAVDVEVLGTVFSVNDRRDKATVSLESGSVKVVTSANELLLKPGQSAEMHPNQLAVLQKESRSATAKREWQSNTLLMDKTTASAVIQILEDNYGLKINTEDQTLPGKQLDGIIPLNDEQKALRILSSITGSHVKRHLNTITLIAD